MCNRKNKWHIFIHLPDLNLEEILFAFSDSYHRDPDSSSIKQFTNYAYDGVTYSDFVILYELWTFGEFSEEDYTYVRG